MKFSYSITCAVMRQPPGQSMVPAVSGRSGMGPGPPSVALPERRRRCRGASDSSRSRPSCARASRPPGSGCAPCPARASAAVEKLDAAIGTNALTEEENAWARLLRYYLANPNNGNYSDYPKTPEELPS